MFKNRNALLVFVAFLFSSEASIAHTQDLKQAQ